MSTRRSRGPRWRRALWPASSGPPRRSPSWRTPDQLREFLAGWRDRHEGPGTAQRLNNQAGRYFCLGHGGLLRRPLSSGWDTQGAPVYRTAAALLPDRPPRPDPTEAATAAVRAHLTWHGPSSRHDIAWWAGVGLTVIDTALAGLTDEIESFSGPDGRIYHDLPGMPTALTQTPGLLLLPEFDALLCGSEPLGRTRFIDPDHHRLLVSSANGLMLPPLLIDGQIGGYCRLDGSGTRRTLTAYCFRGVRRPRVAELREAAGSVSRGLRVLITSAKVRLHR